MNSAERSVREIAPAYAARGWAVFPLHTPTADGCSCGRPDCGRVGKHPRTPNGVKDATTDLKQVEAWWAEWPDANIGIATGAPSGFIVLDVDPIHGGDKSLEALVEKHGGLPKTMSTKTGSGGSHVLFLRPDRGARNRVGFEPGLDIRGDGGYIVAPPSLHASGERYAWQPGDKLAPVPEWLTSATREKSSTAAISSEPLEIPAGARNATLLSIGGSMRARGLSAEAIEAALLQTNAEQEEPLPDDEVKTIVANLARYERGGDFLRDKKGGVLPTQENILLGIAKMGHRLSHNTFADRLLLDERLLDDSVMTYLYLAIERRFKFRAAKDYFWMTVEDAARKNPTHPVREYLDAVEWDGEPRVDEWLVRYAGAPDTPYVRAVSRLILVAAVRRVRHPGCKFDEMLVLESPVQGKEKSTALAILAVRDEWFNDDLPLNADTKRQMEALSGYWIIEAAELKGMRVGDVEHLKSFLSRRVDRARLAYGRLVSERPRQCVVIGSTNAEHYLRDSSGNRRFWPVRIDQFDLEGLRRDRDRLWAEAATIEATGESIRLPRELWPAAAEQQEIRRIEEPFVTRLAPLLEGFEGKIAFADVWDLVGIPPGQRRPDHAVRIGDAMRELGWERSRRRISKISQHCWIKGDSRKELKVVETESGKFEIDGSAEELPF